MRIMNKCSFSTKYTDDETGLVMYQLRAYSPELGRFISRDPIEEAGGENLYSTGNNSLLDNEDYLGLSILDLRGDIGSQILKNDDVKNLSSDLQLPIINQEVFWKAVGEALTKTDTDWAERAFLFGADRVMYNKQGELWSGVPQNRKELDDKYLRIIAQRKMPNSILNSPTIAARKEKALMKMKKASREEKRQALEEIDAEIDAEAKTAALENRKDKAMSGDLKVTLPAFFPMGFKVRGYFHTHPPFTNLVPSQNDKDKLDGYQTAVRFQENNQEINAWGFVAAPEASGISKLQAFSPSGQVRETKICIRYSRNVPWLPE